MQPERSMNTRICSPGPQDNTVRTAEGKVLKVPAGWALCPPGDAALTRRVKGAGDHWLVREKKGRRTFSKGVWAPAGTIERIRADLEAERSTEKYAKRKLADAKRRENVQNAKCVCRRFYRSGAKIPRLSSQPWRFGGPVGSSGCRSCDSGW